MAAAHAEVTRLDAGREVVDVCGHDAEISAYLLRGKRGGSGESRAEGVEENGDLHDENYREGC